MIRIRQGKKMNKIRIIITGLALVAGILFFWKYTVTNGTTESINSQIDYSLWANVLKRYVNDQGRVDYEGLKNNQEELDQFITQVEAVDVSTLSPVEAKNFWINAYNAITLKVVVDKYPVKSIRRINFGLVWEVGRKVAQDKKSLGDIEHKILRPLGDPRIHFAINCASISCPNLPKEPFYPDRLDAQLDYEARRFINDPKKVWLDRDKNILYHSAIFDWFEEDFLVVEPDVLSYIKRYVNEDDKQYLQNNKVSLKKEKYDWGLNKQ